MSGCTGERRFVGGRSASGGFRFHPPRATLSRLHRRLVDLLIGHEPRVCKGCGNSTPTSRRFLSDARLAAVGRATRKTRSVEHRPNAGDSRKFGEAHVLGLHPNGVVRFSSPTPLGSPGISSPKRARGGGGSPRANVRIVGFIAAEKRNSPSARAVAVSESAFSAAAATRSTLRSCTANVGRRHAGRCSTPLDREIRRSAAARIEDGGRLFSFDALQSGCAKQKETTAPRTSASLS